MAPPPPLESRPLHHSFWYKRLIFLLLFNSLSTQPEIVPKEEEMLHRYLKVIFIPFSFFLLLFTYAAQKQQHTTVSSGTQNNLESKLVKMTRKERASVWNMCHRSPSRCPRQTSLIHHSPLSHWAWTHHQNRSQCRAPISRYQSAGVGNCFQTICYCWTILYFPKTLNRR